MITYVVLEPSTRPLSGLGLGSRRDSGVSEKCFASGLSDTFGVELKLDRTAFLSVAPTLAPTVHSAGAPPAYAEAGTGECGYLNFKLFGVEKSDKELGMAL